MEKLFAIINISFGILLLTVVVVLIAFVWNAVKAILADPKMRSGQKIGRY